MLKFTASLLLLACIILQAAAQTYQLVWSDEFNGNSLDTTKWQYEVNCDGGGNNELQCYTSSPSNVAVRNGSLVITAQVQNTNGMQYTSGRINTAASAAWKYGRFDISAQLPNGMYLWPALWLLPRDNVYGGWAASGEIDIMENRGGHNSEDQSTLHFGGAWPNNVYQGSGPTTLGFDMTAGYHLYSAIWTPQSIQFLVDGNVYYTQTLQRSFGGMYASTGSPFDQYFFFIINLAVGGGFFGADSNSLTTAMAQQWASPSLRVDYVRVYQLQTGGVTPNPAPVAPAPLTSTFAAPVATTSSAAAAATPATSSGCPAGYCGAASCCKDQSNGLQCYSTSLYTCAVDSFTGLNSLCQSGFAACRTACYNPTQYSCVNGNLAPGGGPIAVPPAAPSSTYAASTTSTTRASTYPASTYAATPTSSTAKAPSTTSAAANYATPLSNACGPNGCGAGSCCNDARIGGVCYNAATYACLLDTTGYHLCSSGAGVCNGQCFSAASYKCTNGQLLPT